METSFDIADTGYSFEHGFPTPETIQKAYDDADLNRAIQAYKLFYPTVSGAAIFKGNADVGLVANKRLASSIRSLYNWSSRRIQIPPTDRSISTCVQVPGS